MTNIIVVCGEPGVGKSTVADYMATVFDDVKVIDSDGLRKALTEGEPTYDAIESELVYTQMLLHADLCDAETVILDATFKDRRWRERARQLADNFQLVRVHLLSGHVKERLEGGRADDDMSDADFGVHEAVRKDFDRVEMPHVRLGTYGEPGDVYRRATNIALTLKCQW